MNIGKNVRFICSESGCILLPLKVISCNNELKEPLWLNCVIVVVCVSHTVIQYRPFYIIVGLIATQRSKQPCSVRCRRRRALAALSETLLSATQLLHYSLTPLNVEDITLVCRLAAIRHLFFYLYAWGIFLKFVNKIPDHNIKKFVTSKWKSWLGNESRCTRNKIRGHKIIRSHDISFVPTNIIYSNEIAIEGICRLMFYLQYFTIPSK